MYFLTSRKNKAINSDRKSTRLNSSHSQISYAVFCLKKKKNSSTIQPSNQTQLRPSYSSIEHTRHTYSTHLLTTCDLCDVHTLLFSVLSLLYCTFTVR